MKTIGVIGGLSWHSSQQMYAYINQYISQTLGEYNCAKMILVNVNLQEIFVTRKDEQEQVLLEAAKEIQAANCDFYVICSNTMHKHADYLAKYIQTPLLHIADATANAIVAKGLKTVGLMGTRITMEADFYKARLIAKGLNVVIPQEADLEFIDKVLYEETGVGIVNEESSKEFYAIGQRLVDKGAQGIILGCTEIGMLMQQDRTPIPLFDTTIIHGETAAKLAIEEEMRQENVQRHETN